MKKGLAWILLAVMVAVSICMLAGCNTQKAQIRRLDGLVMQQPAEFLRLSNEINPCFTGRAKSDTTIVVGKADTVYQAGDSVILHKHDTTVITVTKVAYINKPVKTFIRDTVPDTRAIATLQSQLSGCSLAKAASDTKLSDAEDTATTRLYWIIGLASLIGITIVVKVYKFFSGGAVVSAVKKVV